jgi:hypothetical protein
VFDRDSREDTTCRLLGPYGGAYRGLGMEYGESRGSRFTTSVKRRPAKVKRSLGLG